MSIGASHNDRCVGLLRKAVAPKHKLCSLNNGEGERGVLGLLGRTRGVPLLFSSLSGRMGTPVSTARTMPSEKTARMGGKARPPVCSIGRRLCCLSGGVPMSDDDEIRSHLTNGVYLAMNEAFCARMRKAIAAGLESAPIGVVTTPGTERPKYVPTEVWLPASSSLSDMDF
jgi:hypothetical protein